MLTSGGSITASLDYACLEPKAQEEGFLCEYSVLPAKDAVIVINVNRLDEDDQSQSSELFFTLTQKLFPDEVNW